MAARPFRVVHILITRPEVGLPSRERPVNGHRAAVVLRRTGLPARELARHIDRFPIIEDERRRGGLKVVGDADLLEPLATMPISGAHAPDASTLVATIGQADAG